MICKKCFKESNDDNIICNDSMIAGKNLFIIILQINIFSLI